MQKIEMFSGDRCADSVSRKWSSVCDPCEGKAMKLAPVTP